MMQGEPLTRIDKSSSFVPPYFIILAGVTILLYFDVVNHFWFLKLFGGFLIKIWLPPFLLFLYVLSTMTARKENIFILRTINLPLVGYAFFGLVSMLLNDSLFGAIKYWLIMIAPVWFYAVLTDGLKENRDIIRILKVLFFCGFLFCVQTAYYRIQSIDSSIEEQEIVTSAGNVISFGGVPSVKVKGEGGFVEYSRGVLNVEHGNYCGMLAPLSLFGMMSFLYARGKVRYVYLLVSILMLAQIIDTMSRTGMVTTAIGLCGMFLLIYCNDKNKRKMVLTLAGGMALASLTYIIASNKVFILLRFLTIFNMFELPQFLAEPLSAIVHHDAIDPHLATMGESIRAFLSSPLFGTGYLIREDGQELNRYLVILSTAGIFTFITYMMFFLGLICLLYRTMRSFSANDTDGANYGYLFFASGVMYFFKLMNQGLELHYYWIMMALASAWARNTKLNIRRGPLGKS